jgi:GT2 family glycosyltransferase
MFCKTPVLPLSHNHLQTLAIIVNYHSALLTLQAVNSVLDSETLGPLRVVVVDNSVDDREWEMLRLGLPSDVSLITCSENMGFGRACNLAFDQFPAKSILLLNPDGRLLPGSLAQLQKTLFSRKRIGAVSPRTYWDNGLRFQLPPSVPHALFEFDAVLNAFGPKAVFSRVAGWMWRCHALKIWQAGAPVSVWNLSGGAVLLKGRAVREEGGLFDPRFFLYFEDTDLFIRLRKAGYSLLIEPRAAAVHHYDQCGIESPEEKRRYMARSRELIVKKYHNPWKSRLKRVESLLRTEMSGCHGGVPATRFLPDSLKELEAPHHLCGKWLFELSPNPNFVPAAGRFGVGTRVGFPGECWDLLSPGRYFYRVGGIGPFHLRLSRATTFEKTL